MTAADFATWLRGFLDALEGPPSAAQLEKIREQLERVAAAPSSIFPFLTQPAFPAPNTPYPLVPSPSAPSPLIPWIGDPPPTTPSGPIWIAPTYQWSGGGGTWCY